MGGPVPPPRLFFLLLLLLLAAAPGSGLPLTESDPPSRDPPPTPPDFGVPPTGPPPPPSPPPPPGGGRLGVSLPPPTPPVLEGGGEEEEEEEETNSTRNSAPCNATLGGPEGWLEAPGGVPGGPGGLDCTYSIRADPGFGLELQVTQLSLSPGETLTAEEEEEEEEEGGGGGGGSAGAPPEAEGSPLAPGQLLRSPSGRLRLRFRSPRPAAPRAFRLRYQGVRLGCPSPPCRPASPPPRPRAPPCLGHACPAGCGGWVPNATRGRVETPENPGGGNGSCRWVLEAPPGHRLHLTFERLALDEDADRFSIRGGPDSRSPLLFDSDLDDVPRGGVLSPGRSLRLELLSEGPRQGPPLLGLRYEAFPAGACAPPRLPHGGVSPSAPPFAPGTLVAFSCRPGYALGGGPPALRCLGPPPPRWNDTPPVCRALCGGELGEAPGVVVPPPAPPAPPPQGQDCVWSIRLPEESRVLLRLQRLSLRPGASLILLDGEEVTGRVLGEFWGGGAASGPPPTPPGPLLSSGGVVTLRYQGGGGQHPGNGTVTPPGESGRDFVIRYEAVPRNDTCPEVPGIPFSRRSASRPVPLRGTVLTFQCRPGFRLRGPELLTCQWDLSWSGPPPACHRVLRCPDPGEVTNGQRNVGDPRFPVGSRVRYSCREGFLLEGSPALTCHARHAGPPKWSDRPPKCVLTYEPCLNPGVPAHGYQTLYKHHYQAGESLRFFCYEGYHLLGEVTVTCLPGRPSRWTSQPPLCKAADPAYLDERRLQVTQRADPSRQLEGGSIALATLLPLLLVLLLIGGVYVYYTNSHSYSPITVESDFNNPLYEAGDTREYEVSI